MRKKVSSNFLPTIKEKNQVTFAGSDFKAASQINPIYRQKVYESSLNKRPLYKSISNKAIDTVSEHAYLPIHSPQSTKKLRPQLISDKLR